MNFGERIEKLERHKDTVNHVAFSPDGKLIASASSDKFLFFFFILNT